MTEKNIRLLIYGSGNVNPINIVLENLRKYSGSNYQVNGLNLYENNQVTTSYKYFDEICKIKKVSYQNIPQQIRKKLIKKKLANKSSIKYLIRTAFKFDVKGLRNFVKSTIELAYYIHQHLEHFENYDVIDVHWITNERANIVAQAPSKCKVVLSFWGSDLMASSGISNYQSVLKAISRADAITLASLEMREIFLSKFGRHFKNKVQLTYYNKVDFPLAIEGEAVNNMKSTWRELMAKHGILLEQFKYVVKVGYSGFETQNHLTIIDQCFQLPEDVKKDLLLVIPMTYGATPAYMEKVEEYAKEKGLAACILRDYLPEKYAISLSYICDVMLNLRDNDGFNNAMIETLMAGKILISGGWLPYSSLRKNKVYFHEVFDFEEVSDVLLYTIQNMEQEKEKAKANPVKLQVLLSEKENGLKWDAVYNKVLGI
jgi:hypothetical protein